MKTFNYKMSIFNRSTMEQIINQTFYREDSVKLILIDEQIKRFKNELQSDYEDRGYDIVITDLIENEYQLIIKLTNNIEKYLKSLDDEDIKNIGIFYYGEILKDDERCVAFQECCDNREETREEVLKICKNSKWNVDKIKSIIHMKFYENSIKTNESIENEDYVIYQGGYYEIKKVHISTIKLGDTILNIDNQLETVNKNNIKFDNFIGTTIFGDSYRSDSILVKKVLIDIDSKNKIKFHNKMKNINESKILSFKEFVNEAKNFSNLELNKSYKFWCLKNTEFKMYDGKIINEFKKDEFLELKVKKLTSTNIHLENLEISRKQGNIYVIDISDLKNFDIEEKLNEAKEIQLFTIKTIRSRGGNSRESFVTDTLENLIKYYSYSLETGKSYEHERGNSKINMNPKNAKSLVDNLNKAIDNAAVNGNGSNSYYLVNNEDNPEFNKKVDEMAVNAKEHFNKKKINTREDIKKFY